MTPGNKFDHVWEGEWDSTKMTTADSLLPKPTDLDTMVAMFKRAGIHGQVHEQPNGNHYIVLQPDDEGFEFYFNKDGMLTSIA